MSCDWLEFQWLNTSYSWLHPTTDSSSNVCYDLRLIPSCGWLCVAADSSSGGSIRITVDSVLQLTTSCGWFYPAADSSSAGWTRLAADLYFNISSKFKDLFCKVHNFYVFFLPPDFSYHWFRLWLLLQEPWRSLSKLEEAWRSFKTLAATDSSCSGWFKLQQLIWGLQPVDYLQNFDPDAPW